MLILTLRTDKPEAEIGLYADEKQITHLSWEAHRKLAETIHQQIKTLLEEHKLKFKDLEGIVIYKGPGSFTGLRIGFSVANALSDSLSIPIVSENNVNWVSNGITRILSGDNDEIAIPEYGSPAKVTTQKK